MTRTHGSVSSPEPKAPTWPLKRSDPLLPPDQLRQMRDTPGLVDIEFADGSTAKLATRYSDVRGVLASEAASSECERFPALDVELQESRGTKVTFDRLDPPEHDRQRAMLAAHFTIKRVERLRPFVESLVSDLLDDLEKSGPPLDLVEQFARAIPSAVVGKLFGIPPEDGAFLHSRIETWMDDDQAPSAVGRANTELIEYLGRQVDSRLAGDLDSDDLFTTLIRDQLVTGALTREDLLETLLLLIVAGYDTSTNMIALGTIVLLETPGAWERLSREEVPLRTAVEELLRFISPAHHAAYRTLKGSVDLGDEVVPSGTRVLSATMAANHDPRQFNNPDRVDIERDARAHVAFGAGVHQCLGQQLARLELEVVFRQLTRRFPTMRLEREARDLNYRNAAVYGVAAVPVSW